MIHFKPYSKHILQINKQIRKCFSSSFSGKNLLNLNDRGFIQDIFPNNIPAIKKLFNSKPQTIYAGFDPTADSLHIGNLLVLMGLLHAQRGGHKPIALLGGATGLIGDPSGRKTERSALGTSVLEKNITAIENQIKRIFSNYEINISSRDNHVENLMQPLRIINNAQWYQSINVAEFMANIGRNFRIGDLLSRSAVQDRLKSESGMGLNEFVYQVFQAYDWLHLFKEYNCRFQIGGSDQMGNIMSGYDLISRVVNKNSAYGITVPIITNEEGDKFGKSAGNAIWLDEQKTSPFTLYQFFMRIVDADVEKLLKLLTFVSLTEVKAIMSDHDKVPEQRKAQKRLAEEITTLIHGQQGLKSAQTITAALYDGNITALGKLNQNELIQSFAGVSVTNIFPEPGMTLLNLAMKAKCFPTERDAERIISAGGFYVNLKQSQNYNEIISPTVHMLPNNMTLLRVGKKNYYLINWSCF